MIEFRAEEIALLNSQDCRKAVRSSELTAPNRSVSSLIPGISTICLPSLCTLAYCDSWSSANQSPPLPCALLYLKANFCRLNSPRQTSIHARYMPPWAGSAAHRSSMFVYFLLPHWVPATWCSHAQTRILVEFPSGKLPTTRVRLRISRFIPSLCLLYLFSLLQERSSSTTTLAFS